MAPPLPKCVDPALAANWDRLKKDVRSCVQSCKDGVLLPRLTADYADLVGGYLPFAKFGFSTVKQMLESMSDVVYFRRDRTGEINVMAVTDESTAHLTAMIAQQRSTTKNKRGGASGRRPFGPRGGMGGTTRGRGAPARFHAVRQPASWKSPSVNAGRIATAAAGFRRPLSGKPDTVRSAWTTTAASGSQDVRKVPSRGEFSPPAPATTAVRCSQDVRKVSSRGESSLSAAIKAHLGQKAQNRPQQAPPGGTEQCSSGSQEIATRAQASPSVPSTSQTSAAALAAFSRGRGKRLPTAALDESTVLGLLGLREIPAARTPDPVTMARDCETEPTSTAWTPPPAYPTDRRSPAAASTPQPMKLPPGLEHWCSPTASLNVSTSRSETPTANCYAEEVAPRRVVKQGLAVPPEVQQELDISSSGLEKAADEKVDIQNMSLDDYQKTINCVQLFEQLRCDDKPSVETDDPDVLWAKKLLRPSEDSTPMTRWEALRMTQTPTNAMSKKLEGVQRHKRFVQSLRETVQIITEKCDEAIQSASNLKLLVREDDTGVDPADGTVSMDQSAEEAVDKSLMQTSEGKAAVEENLPREDPSVEAVITDRRLFQAVRAAPFVPTSMASFCDEDTRQKGSLNTYEEGMASTDSRLLRAVQAAPFVPSSSKRPGNEGRVESSGKTHQNQQGVRAKAVISNAAPFRPSVPNAASEAVATATGFPIVAGAVNPRPIFFFSPVTSSSYDASGGATPQVLTCHAPFVPGVTLPVTPFEPWYYW